MIRRVFPHIDRSITVINATFISPFDTPPAGALVAVGPILASQRMGRLPDTARKAYNRVHQNVIARRAAQRKRRGPRR